MADGLFFLAKLGPGQYTVTATCEGKTVARKFHATPERLRVEYLRWSSNPKTDLAVSRWIER